MMTRACAHREYGGSVRELREAVPQRRRVEAVEAKGHLIELEARKRRVGEVPELRVLVRHLLKLVRRYRSSGGRRNSGHQ